MSRLVPARHRGHVHAALSATRRDYVINCPKTWKLRGYADSGLSWPARIAE